MPAGARVNDDVIARLDQQSRLVLERAACAARALATSQVEPRHVLLAVLVSDDRALVGALARGGASLDVVIDNIVGRGTWRLPQRQSLRRALTTVEPGVANRVPSIGDLSAASRKMLGYAAVEADASGHSTILPTHLVIGLIRDAAGDPLGGVGPNPTRTLLRDVTVALGTAPPDPGPRASLEQSIDHLLRAANDNLRKISDLRDGALGDTVARLGDVSNRLRGALRQSASVGDPSHPTSPPVDQHPGVTIWDGAHVREGATIGEGTSVGRGAYVGVGVVIGRNCKLQNLALVYEPAVLGDGVFIGPAAVLTNDLFPRAVNPDLSRKTAADWHAVGVSVHDGASIGARAVCVAPVSIGQWAMVGAGAVVVSDVPAHALVVGAPARQIGWVGRVGRRLVEESPGRWRCEATGETYSLIDGAMRADA